MLNSRELNKIVITITVEQKAGAEKEVVLTKCREEENAREDAISQSCNRLIVGFTPIAEEKTGKMRILVEQAVRYAYKTERIYFFEHRLFKDKNPDNELIFDTLDLESQGVIVISLNGCNFAVNKVVAIRNFIEQKLGVNAAMRSFLNNRGERETGNMEITTSRVRIIFDKLSPKD